MAITLPVQSTPVAVLGLKTFCTRFVGLVAGVGTLKKSGWQRKRLRMGILSEKQLTAFRPTGTDGRNPRR
jgi:hypothetical protein